MTHPGDFPPGLTDPEGPIPEILSLEGQAIFVRKRIIQFWMAFGLVATTLQAVAVGLLVCAVSVGAGLMSDNPFWLYFLQAPGVIVFVIAFITYIREFVQAVHNVKQPYNCTSRPLVMAIAILSAVAILSLAAEISVRSVWHYEKEYSSSGFPRRTESALIAATAIHLAATVLHFIVAVIVWRRLGKFVLGAEAKPRSRSSSRMTSFPATRYSPAIETAELVHTRTFDPALSFPAASHAPSQLAESRAMASAAMARSRAFD